MKKIIILILTSLLVILSYNYITRETKEETIDTSSITYRVKEKQNLIVEEENITAKAPITEEEFTAYIEEINAEIKTLTLKETLTSSEESTLKNTFITLTDFIFYGGKIKDTTFSELTASTQEKIIELYEQVDAKIEEKIPGYKEKIKETTIKTYNDIKEKLTELKDNITSSYKEEIGEERFNDQLEMFNENKETMQESLEPVIDTIIEESKQVYEETKEQIDNWYQEWKEENS